MRASTPKTFLRAGFLLFPAVILAAAPAVGSSPRCDEPPAPTCQKRVQATWNEQSLAKLELLAMEWVDQERIELERIQLEWAEMERAEMERAELQRIELLLPELERVEVARWVDLEAHVAPILEASTRHLASLRRAPEIESAREASKHLAWKIRDRIASIESDGAHPLNPALQTFVSIAKVSARGIAPLQQALVGVTKAVSHVLLALVA